MKNWDAPGRIRATSSAQREVYSREHLKAVGIVDFEGIQRTIGACISELQAEYGARTDTTTGTADE